MNSKHNYNWRKKKPKPTKAHRLIHTVMAMTPEQLAAEMDKVKQEAAATEQPVVEEATEEAT